MVVCLPVTEDGRVGGGWGRAQRVALATVSDGEIGAWQEVEVGWGTAHDEGTEGSHHARIARFVVEHHVDVVAAGHMGPPMAHMLDRLGIRTVLDVAGDARTAVLAASAQAG